MKKNLSVLLLAMLLVSCGSGSAEKAASSLQHTVQNKIMKKIGDLKPSFYWVAMESLDAQPKTQPLLDIEGRVLAQVSQRYFHALQIEGTGKLLDGRIVNFASRVDAQIRYLVCPPEAPYGYGYDQAILVPFRSVAVDPSVIPLGSEVYIPAAVGAALPDGSIHDGYFRAVDIGDAIQKQRIDIFTSYGDQSAVFGKVGMVHMKPIEVFLVTE